METDLRDFGQKSSGQVFVSKLLFYLISHQMVYTAHISVFSSVLCIRGKFFFIKIVFLI